jgi:hypothetical protein
MKTMTPEMFARYSANPLGMDAEVRNHFQVPDNRYYTVTTWPPERAGQLFVDLKRTRVVHAKKVSKSDQS